MAGGGKQKEIKMQIQLEANLEKRCVVVRIKIFLKASAYYIFGMTKFKVSISNVKFLFTIFLKTVNECHIVSFLKKNILKMLVTNCTPMDKTM